MRAPKEIENVEPTPEQLLRILDSQLADRRSRREGAGRNRATILVLGVLFIVIAAGGALLLLNQMVSDLRQNGGPVSTETAPLEGKF